jgi:hypothetical protein
MSEELPTANPPLSKKEQAAAARLSKAEVQNIDAAILANCTSHWLKVARVMLDTEKALITRYPELSHVFYASRVPKLVGEKRLESRGDLAYMRFSEVRIPSQG